MWKVKHISADNFMSFEKVEYQFEDKCYVVRGENKDNQGQQSNGGGKTSFVDIIAVALLGYSLTGRNVKDCINWISEESFFVIKLYMENEAHKLSCYIERKVYSNTRGQELVLLINDKVPSTLPTKKGVQQGVDTKAGNTYILNEVLGIAEQDLLSYYLISKIHYQPFLNINTDKKLEVIGRFSKANVVDKAISLLQQSQQTAKGEVELRKSEESKIQGYIEALRNSLTVEAKTQFELHKKQQLAQIEQHLNDSEATWAGVASQIPKQQAARRKLKVEVLDPQIKKDLQTRLKGLSTTEHDQLEREINKEIADAQKFIAGLITCPKCEHKFTVGASKYESVQQAEERRIALESALYDIQDDRTSTAKLIVELKEDIELIEQVERENRNTQNQIENINRTIESLQSQADMLKKQQETWLQQYEQIAATTFADEQARVGQQIVDKEKVLQRCQGQLKAAHESVWDMGQWVERFEDFKFYLGNKPIEKICALINQYLKLNGSDLNVHIEGFKKLRSGELRQALTPIIYRNWINPQSISQFSEGERTRLNLSVDLAFQQLINSNSKYGGLDLYVNDELVNPLDSLGVANAARAFNNLHKTILLVSHSGADLIYNNTIVIQKQNQLSTII